uniref:Cytochrome c oxidase polypeptide VIII n=1 Tax=Phlebotomus papatasi TaxID=29031 RepID=A0A1B0DIG1_PHLPP
MISSRLLGVVARNAVQQRSISVVAGPPRVKMSKAEHFVLASIMMGSFVTVPLWILAHIREYRGIA